MSSTAREYDELSYQAARSQAIGQRVDGFGELLVLKDEHGYWGLYFFYWNQEPPSGARPHWLEGPTQDSGAFRPPYEAKRWLEENGYESYQNDLD
jgi:hypothetical protein